MSRVYDAAERIESWARTVISESNADVFWQIPLSKSPKSPYGVGVSTKMLQETLGISLGSATKHRHLTECVIEKMVEAGVVVLGHEAAAIEKRRILLKWFRSLSNDEKLALPTFGNSLCLKRVFTGDLKPLLNADRFRLVREALNEINQSLIDLGVIDPNYRAVKDRGRDRRSHLWAPASKSETQVDRYRELSMLPLHSAQDLLAPSGDRPYIQIEQLFAAASNSVSSNSAKGNFFNASESLKRYFSAQYGDNKTLLAELLGEFTLSRYKKWLEEKVINNDVSPSHGSTLISAVRKAFKRAEQIESLGFDGFFDVAGFDSVRTTEKNKPFSKAERTDINAAIQKDVDNLKRLLKPYQPSGCGENPLNDQGRVIHGKGTLENARWLFENTLNQKAVTFGDVNQDPNSDVVEKAFMSILSKDLKGIHEIYEDWGVISRVDIDCLTPFLLRLAQVTGMNLEPLLTLDIDDFVQSHEATGRPCLRYWKERSDGEKEYHLDLFHADLSWLTSRQSKEVSQIFDDVVSLTRNIRDDVEPKYRQRLFIYQSTGKRTHGVVRPMLLPNEDGSSSSKNVIKAVKRFAAKHSLKNNSGEPLQANVARFRPTFVSELVDQGVSVREIQLMLGHKSIQTTISYLDRMDFNSVARGKVEAALKEIHKRVFKTGTIQNDLSNDQAIDSDQIIFKTPLSACKNIFDPPEFVRRLKSYTPGRACSQYNKCLGCDNVIITSAHLPEIFAMERDYLLLMERSRVMDTPYGHVVAENLELINEIVHPDRSDFSSEELEQGRRLAEYVETTLLVDGVTA